MPKPWDGREIGVPGEVNGGRRRAEISWGLRSWRALTAMVFNPKLESFKWGVTRPGVAAVRADCRRAEQVQLGSGLGRVTAGTGRRGQIGGTFWR